MSPNPFLFFPSPYELLCILIIIDVILGQFLKHLCGLLHHLNSIVQISYTFV